MGSKPRLMLLAAAAAGVALLVWYLAGQGSPAERAGPDRTVREAPPEPPEAPAPKAPEEAGKPAAPGGDAGPSEAVVTEGIRVRVLADGQPLPDARVYGVAGRGAEEGTKEAGGTWLIALTGDVLVGAADAKHGPARTKVHAEPGTITEVTLELGKGETLDILVLAQQGDAPIEGASVYVLRAGGKDLDGGNAGLEDLFAVDDPDFSIMGALDVTDLMQVSGAPAVAIPRLLTGADGRAHVEGLPPGTVDVIVSHPEFIATRLRSKPVGKEAVARLSAGGSLTVLAPYVDGRAAEGYLCGAVRPGLMISVPVGSATVDAEGKASFPHLPPGPLKIVVVKVKHPLALMGVAMGGDVEEEVQQEGSGEEVTVPVVIGEGNVTIVSGKHKTLDLREVKGARIEGVVVGAGEGMTVLLLSGDTQLGAQPTDEKGRFAFEAVAPGQYRLHAVGGSGGIARGACDVKDGDALVTVRLEFPTCAIVGRVLGEDGKPAKGARVLVAPRDGRAGQAANLAELMEQLAGSATAGEDGSFRVAGIPPGEYRVLGAVGHRLDVATVAVGEGAEASVELRVDAARVRRLLVKLEADGKPVEGSVVVLGADGSTAEMLALTRNEELGGGGKAPSHEFFLAPGRYRLVANAAGLAPVLGQPVEIAGDRELTLALGPGVRVELTFEGPDGPAAGRAVDVRTEAGVRLGGQSPLEMLFGEQGLHTDGAGVLALDAVAPGRYVVLVDGKEKGRFEVASSPVAKRIRVE